MTIKKEDQSFNKLKWIIDTLSKDKTKESLQNLYYEDGRLVATCGRMLKTLKIEHEELKEKTLYRLIVSNKDIIIIDEMEDFSLNYPDWQSMINNSCEFQDNLIIKKGDLSNIVRSIIKISKYLKEGDTFYDEFFSRLLGIKTLLKNKGDKVEWNFYADSTLYIESNNGDMQATIMVIKVKKTPKHY